MATTLLSLIQDVRRELSLTVPSAVVSSTDTDIMTTLAHMNAAGYELVNMKTGSVPWQRLVIEKRFTTAYSIQTGTLTSGSAVVTGLSDTSSLSTDYMVTGTGVNQDTYILSVDSAAQVTLSQNASASGSESLTFSQTKYDLPSDFKSMVQRTAWDKSKHWEMIGALDNQQWQWLKSGYISTGPRVRYRVIGNQLNIWPPLSSNEYLGYEYLSNGWARSSGGVLQTKFLADDDTCVWPDRLIINATKLKYFQLKGFNTAALEADFLREFNAALATDNPAPILSMAPRTADVLIGWKNIPDSTYGS